MMTDLSFGSGAFLWLTTILHLSNSYHWCRASSPSFSTAASPATRRATLAFVSPDTGRLAPNIRIGGFRPNLLKLQYSTDGNRNKILKDEDINKNGNILKKAVDNDGQTEDPLLPIYQKVAEQDPLWYDEFVINVLGEELANEIGLPSSIPVPVQQQQQQQEQESLPGTAGTLKSNLTQEETAIPESSSTSATSIQVEPEELAIQKDSAPTVVAEEKVTPKIIKDDIDGPLLVSPENKTIPPTTIDIQSNLTTTNSIDETGKPTDDAKSMDDENDVVLCKDPESGRTKSIALSNLTSLGYSEEEIGRLQSDVIALIISDTVKRPRTGIPAQWQNPSISTQSSGKKDSSGTTSNVLIVSATQAEEILSEEKEARTKTTSTESGQPAVKPPLAFDENDGNQNPRLSDQEIETNKANASATSELTEFLGKNTTSATLEKKDQQNVTAAKPMTSLTNDKKESYSATNASKQRPIYSSGANTVLEETLASLFETKAALKETLSSLSDNVSNEEDVVVYKDTSSSSKLQQLQVVALSILTSMGYSKADIMLLQPDVLDLIVAEEIEKPRLGVPPSWQQPQSRDGKAPADVQVMTRAELEELQRRDTKGESKAATIPFERAKKLDKSQTEGLKSTAATKEKAEGTSRSPVDVPSSKVQAKSPDNKKSRPEKVSPPFEVEEISPGMNKDTEMRPNRAASTFSQRINETGTLLDTASASRTDEVPQAKLNETTATDRGSQSRPVKSFQDALGTEMPPTSSFEEKDDIAATKGSDIYEDLVVVFFDSAKGRQQLVPLQKFTSLGFTRDDVMALQPDVLATIFFEKTKKPRTGIPFQWRNRDNSVSTRAQVLPKPDAEAFAKNEARKASRGRDTGGSKPTGGNPRATAPPSRQRKQVRRSREKSAYNPDGSKKSIYNVRAGKMDANAKRMRGVDPPGNKFWMDIDTFRGLLRKEAEFRLRITGGRFAEDIKSESDWRLGLYENWLWALHKGVGEPIRLTGRDRGRPTPAQPPPTNRRKPSNRKRRTRSRERSNSDNTY